MIPVSFDEIRCGTVRLAGTLFATAARELATFAANQSVEPVLGNVKIVAVGCVSHVIECALRAAPFYALIVCSAVTTAASRFVVPARAAVSTAAASSVWNAMSAAELATRPSALPVPGPALAA